MLNNFKFKIKPFNYQLEKIKIALNTLYKEKIFAFLMEMGLGKTKCSLNTAEYFLQHNVIDMIMIVCPKILYNNWAQEITEQTYIDPYILCWESGKLKTKKYQRKINEILDTKKTPIFIMNTETFQTPRPIVKKIIEAYNEKYRIMCILDESSKIKTHDATRTKVITDYLKDIDYKAILTGTEITNSAMDLYSQFEFLKHNFWNVRNFYAFRAKYAILEQVEFYNRRANKTVKFKKVVGYRKLDELHDYIAPYCARARKEDCLDLPEKIHQDIVLKMSPEMEKMYAQLKKDLYYEYQDKELNVTQKMSLFTYFRQITGGFFPENMESKQKIRIMDNPKLDFIKMDTEDYKGKIVIATTFVAELSMLVEELPGAIGLYGETKDRDYVLDTFKNDPEIKYLVCSMGVGAFGLNLQFCSLVYLYTCSLPPEENWQFEDRFHRIGQKNNVTYKRLMIENSVDFRVKEIQTGKTNLRDAFSTGNFFDYI